MNDYIIVPMCYLKHLKKKATEHLNTQSSDFEQGYLKGLIDAADKILDAEFDMAPPELSRKLDEKEWENNWSVLLKPPTKRPNV